MNIARLTIIAVILILAAPRVFAQAGAEPGKSLEQIPLGISRSQAIARAQTRFSAVKAHPSRHTYRLGRGIVEDTWNIRNGDNSQTFAVLSQYGRVVQLRAWTSGERGQTNLSFAQLLRRHPLQKRVYVFEGASYAGFYYDDLKRGICYSLGVQEAFLLTSHPDAIIVHRAGVPAIPIEDGIRGRRESGPATRAYANEAEARRAEQRRLNHD